MSFERMKDDKTKGPKPGTKPQTDPNKPKEADASKRSTPDPMPPPGRMDGDPTVDPPDPKKKD